MAKLCPEPKLRRALEALDAYPDEGLLELAELARKYPQDAQLRAMTGMAFVEEGEAWRGLARLKACRASTSWSSNAPRPRS